MTAPSRPDPKSQQPWTPDASAFVQLFTVHQRSVHAYISTLVPSMADADDIMQEPGLTPWQKFEEFDPQRDFFRWACGIAFVAVLRYRRRTARDKLWFNEVVLQMISSELLEYNNAQDLRRTDLMEAPSRSATCWAVSRRSNVMVGGSLRM